MGGSRKRSGKITCCCQFKNFGVPQCPPNFGWLEPRTRYLAYKITMQNTLLDRVRETTRGMSGRDERTGTSLLCRYNNNKFNIIITRIYDCSFIYLLLQSIAKIVLKSCHALFQGPIFHIQNFVCAAASRSWGTNQGNNLALRRYFGVGANAW